jgi:hypothetical protein
LVELSVLLSEIDWFCALMERDSPLIIYCMFMLVLSVTNSHIHQDYCVYCNCRNMKNLWFASQENAIQAFDLQLTNTVRWQ